MKKNNLFKALALSVGVFMMMPCLGMKNVESKKVSPEEIGKLFKSNQLTTETFQEYIESRFNKRIKYFKKKLKTLQEMDNKEAKNIIAEEIPYCVSEGYDFDKLCTLECLLVSKDTEKIHPNALEFLRKGAPAVTTCTLAKEDGSMALQVALDDTKKNLILSVGGLSYLAEHELTHVFQFLNGVQILKSQKNIIEKCHESNVDNKQELIVRGLTNEQVNLLLSAYDLYSKKEDKIPEEILARICSIKAIESEADKESSIHHPEPKNYSKGLTLLQWVLCCFCASEKPYTDHGYLSLKERQNLLPKNRKYQDKSSFATMKKV